MSPIARALVRNPRILIVDEATSALDNESVGIVLGNINKALGDRTVFTIAHRLSTVASADLIVVIEGGNIQRTGYP